MGEGDRMESGCWRVVPIVVMAAFVAGCLVAEPVGLDCTTFAGYIFEATVSSAGFTLELQSGYVVGPFYPTGTDAWNQTRTALMDGSLVKITACERDDGRSYYDTIEVAP